MTTHTKVFLLAFETTWRMLPLCTLYVWTIDGKTGLCQMSRVLFSSVKWVWNSTRSEPWKAFIGSVYFPFCQSRLNNLEIDINIPITEGQEFLWQFLLEAMDYLWKTLIFVNFLIKNKLLSHLPHTQRWQYLFIFEITFQLPRGNLKQSDAK